ncbi:hypothetical protein QBC43DRAFT_320704 [Cladorrhinum sp. PSN259]|nr:hypothetical protein QBC43DRAFT_320704 [Cladorrhinum sp. PSN259]
MEFEKNHHAEDTGYPAQLSLPIPRDDDRFSSYSAGGRELDSPASPVGPSSTFNDHQDAESSKLYRYALPVALVVGLLIIGGGTAGIVVWVQGLVKNAKIDNNPVKWKTAARSQVYDACYFGCNDCNDPNFAWKACQKSAKVTVNGVMCDASKMWNWAQTDRYPDACLPEVGKILAAESLASLKKKHSAKYAIIVAAAIGGALIAWLVFFLMRKFSGVKKEKPAEAESTHSSDPGSFSLKRPATWKINPYKPKSETTRSAEQHHSSSHGHHDSSSIHHAAAIPASEAAHEVTSSLLDRPSSRDSSPGPFGPAAAEKPSSPGPFGPESPTRRSSTSSRSSRSSRGSSGPRLSGVLTSAISIAASVRSADAYACTGKDPVHNQHFVSVATIPGTSQPRISGVIHGWLSDCTHKNHCKDKCQTKCKRATTSNKTFKPCNKSCKKECKKTKTIKSPKEYVDAVVPKLAACGFRTADAVSQTVDTRVGNANIERNLWVRISVSGFNVTNGGETDKEVFCLHGIAG